MRLVKLVSTARAPIGAQTADPEICRQLWPASFRLKLLLTLRTTVHFFLLVSLAGYLYLRFLFVSPPLFAFIVSKKGSSTKN